MKNRGNHSAETTALTLGYRAEEVNQDFPAAPPDAQKALIGPTPAPWPEL